jgi:hypothetical protein
LTVAETVDFPGSTHDFGPPAGEEERCGRLHCMLNGSQVVSAWRFTPDQLREMADSGEPVYVSVWSGTAVFPIFVGTRSEVNALLLDFGSRSVG